MIDSKSVAMFKTDVGKVVTLTIISVVFKKFILKLDIDPFSDSLIQGAMSTIIGFAVYEFITYKFNDLLKLEGSYKLAWVDILKFGTMMVVKEFVLASYKGTDVDPKKYIAIGAVLAGFIGYDIFIKPKIPKKYGKSKYDKSAITDTIKTMASFIAGDILIDGDIEVSNLPQIVSLLIAVPIFHIVVRPIIDKI